MKRMQPTDGFSGTVIERLLRAAKPINRGTGVLLALAITGAVAVLDHWVSPTVQVTVMYMFGPGAAAWTATRRDAILIAFLAAFTSTAVHGHPGAVSAQLVSTLGTLLIHFAALGSLAMIISRVHTMAQNYEALSMCDDLTALLNRRALAERLGTEIARSRRYSTPFALIYADVDWFKDVNDHRGHAAGDEFLIRIAETIQRALRPTDIAARMGGDEFLVVLPETDEEGARALAARLDDGFAVLEREYGTGLSLGIAAFSSAPESVEAAIKMADAEMYAAKRARKLAPAPSSRTDGVAPTAAPPQSAM